MAIAIPVVPLIFLPCSAMQMQRVFVVPCQLAGLHFVQCLFVILVRGLIFLVSVEAGARHDASPLVASHSWTCDRLSHRPSFTLALALAFTIGPSHILVDATGLFFLHPLARSLVLGTSYYLGIGEKKHKRRVTSGSSAGTTFSTLYLHEYLREC